MTFPGFIVVFGLAICVGLPIFMYLTAPYSRQFDPGRSKKLHLPLTILYALIGVPIVIWGIVLWASGVTRASEVFG